MFLMVADADDIEYDRGRHRLVIVEADDRGYDGGSADGFFNCDVISDVDDVVNGC